MDTRNLLIYYAEKHEGNFSKILNALMYHEKANSKEVDAAVERYSSSGEGILTAMDLDYSEEYKDMPEPPFVLFYNDRRDMLKSIKNNVGIISADLKCSRTHIRTVVDYASVNEKTLVILLKDTDCLNLSIIVDAAINAKVNIILLLPRGITSKSSNTMVEHAVEEVRKYSRGAIVSLFSDKVEHQSEETLEETRALFVKMCEEIIMLGCYDDRHNTTILRTALESHKKVRGFSFKEYKFEEGEGRPVLNDIMCEAGIVEEI